MRFGGFGYEQQFGFGLSPTPAASAAPGYAAWPALVGAERIQGGGCNDPLDWTLGTGITVNVVAGKMVATTASAFVQNDGTMDGFIEGSTVRTSGTVDTATLGSFIILVENVSGAPITTAGAFSQDIVAGEAGNDGWQLQFTSATMQLDNFSVKSIGLMGIEGDWDLSGASSIYWNTGTLQFDGAAAGEDAELTGSAKTAFDAAVSNSTVCSVTVSFPAGATLLGTVTVALKGGSAVAFVGDGVVISVTHNVTSGAGSGFVLTAGNDGPAGSIARIQIALA